MFILILLLFDKFGHIAITNLVSLYDPKPSNW